MAKAGQRRVRIQVKQTDSGCWYAVVVDRINRERDRGPVRETEYDAAQDADNQRRFGAWEQS